MSRRAKFWQQLLQLRDRIMRRDRAILGVWPGLLTLCLLFFMLLFAITLLSRANGEASAQSPSSSALAQIATRTPTRRATVSSTATKIATRTATSTATPRPPTPTWTPFPTATQIAASPLLTQTTVLTHIVPLPTGGFGPELAPAATITDSRTISESVTPEQTPTPTADALTLLIPTATPTRTIVEALEQPVAPGGLAGMAATATAAAPAMEQSATEMPTVTEAQPAVEPMPTAASLPTPDGNVRTARVPILMYHYLSVPPANADRYRLDLSVTPDLFAAHLDAMQQAGYTTISFYALIDHLTHGSPLPEKPVILTFDDGYRDNYENAFPALRNRGMTATFFIVTDFIHDQRPEYVTWDMVREMYAGGMSIEAHGRNHVSLANKDTDYLVWQALGSFEDIEREIGVRPHFLSYPAGEYDQLTIDIFRSANYWAAVTTQQGATHRSDDLFRLRRVRIRGTTTSEELLRLLTLDW